jgi:hypothetical protein
VPERSAKRGRSEARRCGARSAAFFSRRGCDDRLRWDCCGDMHRASRWRQRPSSSHGGSMGSSATPRCPTRRRTARKRGLAPYWAPCAVADNLHPTIAASEGAPTSIPSWTLPRELRPPSPSTRRRRSTLHPHTSLLQYPVAVCQGIDWWRTVEADVVPSGLQPADEARRWTAFASGSWASSITAALSSCSLEILDAIAGAR